MAFLLGTSRVPILAAVGFCIEGVNDERCQAYVRDELLHGCCPGDTRAIEIPVP